MRSTKADIFIGWDPAEDISASVCRHSIVSNTKAKFAINFLKQYELRAKKLYWRAPDQRASTEFTFTRFLVPALCNYKGVSIFLDSDFLFLNDVSKLFSLFDSRYAVQVVKHDYNPTNTKKKAGQAQENYPRKNWSSLILWNNAHPKNRLLTPKLINKVEASYLHRFSWLQDDEIGEIPLTWNWLVNWYQEPKDGKPMALHFTEGGPWLKQHRKNPYVPPWDQCLNNFLAECRREVSRV